MQRHDLGDQFPAQILECIGQFSSIRMSRSVYGRLLPLLLALFVSPATCFVFPSAPVRLLPSLCKNTVIKGSRTARIGSKGAIDVQCTRKSPPIPVPLSMYTNLGNTLLSTFENCKDSFFPGRNENLSDRQELSNDASLRFAGFHDDDYVRTTKRSNKNVLWAPATSVISWREYRARLVKVRIRASALSACIHTKHPAVLFPWHALPRRSPAANKFQKPYLSPCPS